jgi:uncharacterized protein (TIGR03000 family)
MLGGFALTLALKREWAMRNRILLSAVLFSLAVVGSALWTGPAQAQGYYPMGGRYFYSPPPSINYPSYSTTTVNLAAISPAIVNTYNPPGYSRGSIISYGGYSPLVPARSYALSPLLTTGEDFGYGPTGTIGPMGEFSLYNPAAINDAYANALNAYATSAYANAYANAAYANAYANAAYVNAYANATYANAYANAANAYATQAQTELYSPQFTVATAAPAYTQLQAGPSGEEETNVVGPPSSPNLGSNGNTTRRESENSSSRNGRRTTAYIDIRVPANAELWFGGVKTSQTGRVRRFISPPLTPGKDFAYNVRVTWTANGKKVTKRQRIVVRAGEWVRLNWASPSRDMATASR